MFTNLAIQRLKHNYKNLYSSAMISEVRIGPFLCAVTTDSGFCGVSGIDHRVCNESSRREKLFGNFTPGGYRNQKVSALLEFTGKNPHLQALKIAALNALTAHILADDTAVKTYGIIPAKDPVELLDEKNIRTICIVGAFESYIRRYAERNIPFVVLELDKEAFAKEDLIYYRPAAEAYKVIPAADAIIITASAIANNTLQELLGQVRQGCQVLLTGPTGGFVPEIFFERGVTIIGSVRVNDSKSVMEAISEGAFAYHLFGRGAEKICIVNERTTP